jgi:predicted transcriptional regulator
MSTKKNTKFRKKYAFFLHIADTVICMNRSSYNFSDTFKERLETLAEKLGKTQTAVIVDAVNAYASGTLPDKAVIGRLDTLAANDGALKKDVDELKTLITQVLKNQQKGA